MKLGYSNSLYPEALDVSCSRAARCGYDAVELLVDDALLESREEIRALLAKHDLRLAAGAALMTSEREIIHPDPDVREAAIRYLSAAVDLVGGLGARVLTIAPGADGRLEPWAPEEQERKWCIEGLRAAQEVGDRVGLRIGIEPVCRFETYCVNRGEQALRLAEDVGPSCGVVLDVFHMFLEELDPLYAIKRVSQRLVNFHVAEHNRLPPGFGAVPWSDVLGTLETAGYQGYVTLEFAAPEMWPGLPGAEDPYSSAIGKAAQVLRRYMMDM